MNQKLTVLYCRTSTSMQSTGLEAQERALVDYCKIKGITNYRIFKDEGISGSKASRPSLDAMMGLVRANKVNSVIVYSFSRFARSTRHLLDALEEFRQRNVAFTSMSENIQTDSAIGLALFTIISAISQLERELVSERVKNGLKNAKAKGKKLGRPKKRNSDLIIELRGQGMSHRRIAKLVKCSTWSVFEELRTRLENKTA